MRLALLHESVGPVLTKALLDLSLEKIIRRGWSATPFIASDTGRLWVGDDGQFHYNLVGEEEPKWSIYVNELPGSVGVIARGLYLAGRQFTEPVVLFYARRGQGQGPGLVAAALASLLRGGYVGDEALVVDRGGGDVGGVNHFL